LNNEEKIYKRIGEFVVTFQWIENKLREIGWFILDPSRSEWPPCGFRNLTNENLINKVHKLFLEALPKCELFTELETEYKESFEINVEALHKLRRDRNKILHSAFIELKAGGEVKALMRSNPNLGIDEETGDTLFDQEYLSPDSFKQEMKKMAEIGFFLGQVYIQLSYRYPYCGA
jgi:hypothetical protein